MSTLTDEELDRRPTDEDAAIARRELARTWPFSEMTATRLARVLELDVRDAERMVLSRDIARDGER